MKKASRQELRRCTEILEAVAADRSLIDRLTDEDRIALLRAAGRASRPTRHELTILNKSRRKAKRVRAILSDKKALASTEIRTARLAKVYVPPAKRNGTGQRLRRERSCYVCKRGYKRLHFFYDSMCSACAEFNYEKRFQTADLQGRVALITGSRLKIGYQAALKMLRAGATVIATTRFPHDSAERYAREQDYGGWRDRLHVYGLDLRHSPSVELFARWVESSYDRLDILVNNAAQTVRRPPGFYAHLIARESLPREELTPEARPLLERYAACTAGLSRGGAPRIAGGGPSRGLTAWSQSAPGIGIREPARLSQLPYAFDDSSTDDEVFPLQRLDADLQQVDMRQVNSWRLGLAEVSTPEMLELQLVNSVAPYILCAKLKPLMLRHDNRDKHIVNVSAMEGSFSRHTKTDKHPHTNMAKAALNMMTLTSAPDYAGSGIYMNAVDTGWVTDEDPAQHAERKRMEHGFEPPLDIVDGAARVCDPFFSGLNSGCHVYGKFLKDYRPTDW
ncbi:MAG: SDR family oxidoreductase [Elusimicrobiota bacterium]